MIVDKLADMSIFQTITGVRTWFLKRLCEFSYDNEISYVMTIY